MTGNLCITFSDAISCISVNLGRCNLSKDEISFQFGITSTAVSFGLSEEQSGDQMGNLGGIATQ